MFLLLYRPFKCLLSFDSNCIHARTRLGDGLALLGVSQLSSVQESSCVKRVKWWKKCVKLTVENLSLYPQGHTELRHLTLSSSVVFEVVEHIMVRVAQYFVYIFIFPWPGWRQLMAAGSAPGRGTRSLHLAMHTWKYSTDDNQGDSCRPGSTREWEMKFSLVKLLLFTLRSPGWISFQCCPFSRQEKMGAAIQHHF